jgi:glycosyltransferase involved in cell wall biosynthesis
LFARYLGEIIDNPDRASLMGRRAAKRASRYTWGFAAARLRRVYTDLTVRELVACA